MNQFSKRRPLSKNMVPFGHIDPLWLKSRHKSGLSQGARLLQGLIAAHTPDEPIHTLSKASLHGDLTALGALHDYLDEQNHPLSGLNWRGLMHARKDEMEAAPHMFPGNLFKTDKILWNKANARQYLDRRLEEKRFADNRVKANSVEQKKRGTPTRLASYQSPPGTGITVRGQYYPGGKFVSNEAIETNPEPQQPGLLARIVQKIRPRRKRIV